MGELYAWLGLTRSIPQAVHEAIDRCGLRGSGQQRPLAGRSQKIRGGRRLARLKANLREREKRRLKADLREIERRRYRVCGNTALPKRQRGAKLSSEQARVQEEADDEDSGWNEGQGGRANLSSALQLQLARECGSVLRWFADGTPPPHADS